MAFGSPQWMYASGEDYEIPYSCRFDYNTDAYLSRTPSSSSNRKTWTFSCWFKRGNMSDVTGSQNIFGVTKPGGQAGSLKWGFLTDDKLYIADWHGIELTSKAVYRDPNAWYHIILAWDTTQATETNRVKLYVNGVLIELEEQSVGPGWSGYPPEDDERYINSTEQHCISTRYPYHGDMEIDGLMAEVHFIDGTALTATSFGETGDYGEWKPKEYSGSYGTNGFYLDFADSGDLGDDESGNGNDWTENNIAASDQMFDSPTNNFATINPLTKEPYTAYAHTNNLYEGNLKADSPVDWSGRLGTFSVNSGKWYWECRPEFVDPNRSICFGIVRDDADASAQLIGRISGGIEYMGNGVLKVDNVSTDTYALYPVYDNTIMAVALDLDSTPNTVKFYKNNSLQGTVDLTANFTGTGIVPFFNSWQLYWSVNFGQDSSFAGLETAQGNADANGIGDFFYEPPSGYLAMCTSNLADVDVTPSEHYNTVTYTGNASTQSITGVGFQPDFTWIKKRNLTERHCLTDAVRGVNSQLQSSMGDAETTATDRITSFDSDGFSLGADAGMKVNYADGDTFVAWNWKANGAGSANTDGDMAETVTVSANADAGFSIVKYTGDGAAATIGHGLSKAPEMIIIKNIDVGYDIWRVYHSSIASDAETDWLILNDTNATQDHIDEWNDTAPTSSVFTVGTAAETNRDDHNFIAYCFHSVDGYSKVGSYTGNGNVDGTFAYTGFRPAYVLIKCSNSGTNGHWFIFDSVRQTYNVIGDVALAADLNLAEGLGSTWNPNTSGAVIDFLSNGFKIRTTATSGISVSGQTYIYLAFAETPFKYSNAR